MCELEAFKIETDSLFCFSKKEIQIVLIIYEGSLGLSNLMPLNDSINRISFPGESAFYCRPVGDWGTAKD